VSDQPWVTGAETSELVLALAAVGEYDRGAELLDSVQHLRDPDDGAYWTGYQFVHDVRWPVEPSTWTTAAMILAVDALCGATPGAGRSPDRKRHRSFRLPGLRGAGCRAGAPRAR